MPAHAETAAEPCYVSTGHLPEPDLVMTAVQCAYDCFKGNTGGRNSDIYSALARVPSDLCGVCVVGTSGNVCRAGDADCDSAFTRGISDGISHPLLKH